MARQSEANKRNEQTVRDVARSVLADTPELLNSPAFASRVVERLRRSSPSAISYMNKHCGSANAEVSTILSNMYPDRGKRR